MKLLCHQLGCRRGARPVFADVSFALASGEALVVTGRNGSGKSSLIAILAGLLRPEAGSVQLDPAGEAPVADRVNLVGHRDGLKAALTAAENLAFAQGLLGEPAHPPRRALAAMGLGEAADLPVAYLSAGQRRRVALARLLVCGRPIWLLDEPTAALDAAASVTLSEIMSAHLARGGLIVAATHAPLGLDGAKQLRLGDRAGLAAPPDSSVSV